MTTTYTDNLKKSLPERGQTNWHDEWWRNNNIDDALFRQLQNKFFTVKGGAVTKLTTASFSVGDVVVKAYGETQVYSGVTYTFDSTGNPATPQFKTDALATVRTWYLFVRTQDVSPPLPYYGFGFNLKDHLPSDSLGDVLVAIIDVDDTEIINIIDVRSYEQDAVKDLPGLGQATALDETPVDWLLCDVANDSDGGAWTERVKHTSWYNEALGTSIRGVTRDFPKRFVVAAYTESVVIFDATQEDLPMWMVIPADKAGKSIFANSTSPIACLAYKDGLLVVGSNNVSATGALNFIDFISDETWLRINTLHRYYRRPIEGRDTAVVTTEQNEYNHSLTNPSINDVAITILEDAAINPETGLPQPTIITANDAAVDIVDGPAGLKTVAKITNGTEEFKTVNVWSNNKLAIGQRDYGMIEFGDIPSSNQVTSTWRDGIFYDTQSFVYDLNMPMTTGGKFVEGGALADGNVTLLKQNLETPENSLAAYVGQGFNTGWLCGNVRYTIMGEIGAATVGDDLATELLLDVTPGAFDSWVEIDLGTGGSASAANGVLSVTNGGTAGAVFAQQDCLTLGENYRVQLTCNSYTTAWGVSIGTGNYNAINAAGVHTVTGVATTDGILRVGVPSAAGTRTVEADNVYAWLEGTEEVSNGDFSGGTTDWAVSGAGSIAVASGQLTVTVTTPTAIVNAYQIITNLEADTVYELLFDFVSGDPSYRGALIGRGSTGNADYGSVLNADCAVGTNKLTFMTDSSGTDAYLMLRAYNTPCTYDNISVKKITNKLENGEFSSDRGWTKGTGWSISNGQLKQDGSYTAVAGAVQAAGLVASQKYILQFDLVAASGDATYVINIDGNWFGTANIGVNEILLTAYGGNFQILTSSTTGRTCTIEDIKLYVAEYVNGTWQPTGNLVQNPSFEGLLPNDAWTAMNAAFLEVQDEEIYIKGTGSTNPYLYQRIDDLTPGRVYEFDVTCYAGASGGSLRARAGTTVGGEQYFNHVVSPGASPGASYTFAFRPTETYAYMRIGSTGGTTDEMWFSGVSVKLSENYIANFNFDAEGDYWVDQLNGSSGGSIGYSSNVARITQGTNSVWMGTSQSFDVVEGETYHLQVEYTYAAAGVAWRLTANIGTTSFLTTANCGASEGVSSGAGTETHELIFTAASTGTVYLGLLQGGVATTVVDMDNVRVISLNDLPDRSIYKKGFHMQGQLDREPVEEGAELCAYSGFDASNYPWQPYLEDIDDIGTGDCWFRFWIQTTSNTSGYIYNRRSEDSSGNHTYFLTNTSNSVIAFRLRNTGDGVLTGTKTVNDGRWHQIIITRDSAVGDAYLYVDGELDTSGAQSQSLDLGTDDEIIKWGIRMDGLTPFNGSLSLCAQGSGHISAEQARFMFEQERQMFRTGQKVTPYYDDEPDIVDISQDKETGAIFLTNYDFVSEYQGLVPALVRDDFGEDIQQEYVTQSLPAGTAHVGGRVYSAQYSGGQTKVSFTVDPPGDFAVLVTNLGANDMVCSGGGGVAGFVVTIAPGQTNNVGFADQYIGTWLVECFSPDSATPASGDDTNYFEIRFHKAFSSLNDDILGFERTRGMELTVNDSAVQAYLEDINFFEELAAKEKQLVLAQEVPRLYESVAAAGVTTHWCEPGWYPIRVYGSGGSVQLDSAWTRVYDGFRYGVEWSSGGATLRIEQKRIAY